MKRLIFWGYSYFKETFIYKYIYIYNWRYSIFNWGAHAIGTRLGHIVGAIPNKIAVAVCSCSIRTKFTTGQHVYGGGCGGFVTKAWMCIHHHPPLGWLNGKNISRKPLNHGVFPWKIVLQISPSTSLNEVDSETLRHPAGCFPLNIRPNLPLSGARLAAANRTMVLGSGKYGSVSKPWYLVNPKIAGKWMFIPIKMVLIGIDPYPYRETLFSSVSQPMYPRKHQLRNHKSPSLTLDEFLVLTSFNMF